MGIEPTADAGAVSLDGFKKHAKIVGATRDDELQVYLDAACEMVEAITAVDVTAPTQELAVVAAGSMLVLPVVRVSSVEALTDPGGRAVDPSACTIDLRSGIVTVPSASAGTWKVELSHTIPASMVLAVYIIATHLLQTERGSAGMSRATQQPEAIATGWGYAIPNRARDLLEPYVGPGFA